MKPLLGGTLLWAVIAIATGVLGDSWLSRLWRVDAETAFQRDARLALGIVRDTTWPSALDTSAAWAELERALTISIVVEPYSPTSSDGQYNVASGPDETLPVNWFPAAGGRYRVSTVTAARVNAQLQRLRLTRELAGPPLRAWWWWMWGLGQLLAVLYVFLGLRLGLDQLAKQRSVLNPWLNALRYENTQEVLLPPIEELESELEPALTLIAERVNRMVAELENFKQRSELVLGNLQEGVLAVDDRSSILLANNSLLRLLEVQDDSYLNRPLLEIIRAPIVQQLIEQVLRQKVPREETCEFGSPEKQLRLQAKPLPLGRMRVGVLLTVRDETMLKRIESIRRDFVTNASHELKTPLAAIRAYAETLQLGAIEDPEAAEGFVSNIIAQADRINNLVQGMLQLSRVQSGTGLRIEDFDVEEALKPCLSAVLAMAKAKGVAMQVGFPIQKKTIKSDRDGVQTIVSNLLSNAVRYTPEGGSVTLSVTEEGEWLSVVVADTGIGIKQADLDRIFERFYRAEKDRAADTGGTGLGLSIVKNLVQVLEGSVNVWSEPNQGSRFEVRLPLGSS
jgi:two-component system, OmpR family, phosphate regulon sensor histidine kinase PhoR